MLFFYNPPDSSSSAFNLFYLIQFTNFHLFTFTTFSESFCTPLHTQKTYYFFCVLVILLCSLCGFFVHTVQKMSVLSLCWMLKPDLFFAERREGIFLLSSFLDFFLNCGQSTKANCIKSAPHHPLWIPLRELFKMPDQVDVDKRSVRQKVKPTAHVWFWATAFGARVRFLRK